MSKYGVRDTEITFYNAKSGEPLLIVEDAKVNQSEKGISFTDRQQYEIVKQELLKIGYIEEEVEKCL